MACHCSIPFQIQALCSQVCTGSPEHQIVFNTLEHNEEPAGTQRSSNTHDVLESVWSWSVCVGNKPSRPPALLSAKIGGSDVAARQDKHHNVKLCQLLCAAMTQNQALV
jgi:hypothetical protein